LLQYDNVFIYSHLAIFFMKSGSPEKAKISKLPVLLMKVNVIY